MNKSKLYYRCLIAIIFSVLLIQFGCKKEKGFYSTTDINASTPLNTYEYLKSKPGVYDSLLSMIDQFGMQQYLIDSNITLFAVSNPSFRIALNNLNNLRKTQGKPNVFLAELASGIPSESRDRGKAKADSAQIDTMISYYIIKGAYKSSDFTVGDGQNIYSVRGDFPMHGKRLYADAEGHQDGGSEIIEFANTDRSVFIPNWSLSTTSSVNIETKNGVVHLLQPDHVFGFNEFVSRLTFIPPPKNLFKNLGSIFSFRFQDPAEFDGRISPGEKFIKVHDGNVLTKFLSGFNPNSGKVYMQWESPEPIVSNVYTLTSANDAEARDMKSWRLEGSLDNVNWTTLDTRQDQIFESRFQTKIFDFDNATPYKYYRMTILTNRGDGLFQVAEWTMNYRQTYE
ncbi:MAG: ATP/GTP-binding protein [Sphingobacteriaceae bacterium]